MTDAELRVLGEEVHKAYQRALQARREAIELERRYREALKVLTLTKNNLLLKEAK